MLENSRARTDRWSCLLSRRLVRDATGDMVMVVVASARAVQRLRVQNLGYIGNKETSRVSRVVSRTIAAY